MVSPDTADAEKAGLAPYARVKRFLKEGLQRGEWAPGALMPSEADLVARFGVSRMTVNRALSELRAEGLVERAQGVGTFAAPRHRLASTLTIRDLHDEIEARGQRHTAELLLKAEEAAPPALAERLGLAPGAPVFHTVIVHRADGVPMQLEDRYVNPAAAPGYLDVDFTATTPTRYLLQVAPLWEAEYAVEAAAASADEARRLAIAPGDPCLVVVRRTRRHDGPITLARLVHPGSRYQIEGGFRP